MAFALCLLVLQATTVAGNLLLGIVGFYPTPKLVVSREAAPYCQFLKDRKVLLHTEYI